MYKTLLSKLTMNAIYSSGVAFLYLFYDSKRMESTSFSPLSQESFAYKQIQTIFSQMGNNKKIRIVTANEPQNDIARCTSIPFYPYHHVQVSPLMIKKLSNETGMSNEDIINALFAHEATHAIEYHKYFITSSATNLAMLAYDVGKHLRLPKPITLTISFLACSSIYITLSKQMENRADHLAAKHSPQIHHTLISILSEMERKHPSNVKKFFSLHPSHRSRIKNLHKIFDDQEKDELYYSCGNH